MVRSRPAPDASAASTRERLLAAAVRVLQEEGETAVSTTRLTAEVGIVQSGFYSHFPSLDAVLAEAAAQVVADVRGPLRDWMRQLRRLDLAAPEGTVDNLRDHMQRVLVELRPRWPALAAVQRHRREQTAVGRTLAAAYDDVVDDVTDYLTSLAVAGGVSVTGSCTQARLAMLAGLVTEMVLHVLESVARSPRPDLRAAADLLACSISPAVVSVILPEPRGAEVVSGA